VGRGGAAGVASVRRCQKLPTCLIDPMLDSSKTDPLRAKAEPISKSGSTSVMIYLKKGEKIQLHNSSWKKGMRLYEKNNPANTKVSEKGGGRCAPGAAPEIPCSQWRRP